MRVPLFRVDDDEGQAAAIREAVLRVADAGRYVLGREVDRFEHEFAQWSGARACVGVANGTDALELALRATGVRRDDIVVMAANAGCYASNAAAAIGARPRYVDVSRDHVVTPAQVGDALSGAAAIVVTHLYGRMAPVADIAALARGAGVALVEDCAQAHGGRHEGRMAGTFGDAGCFSFYPTKNLGALGDAGAVVTSRDDVAAAVRAMRQYGWDGKYRVACAGGRNSRLDEMQAAVLRAKLPRLAQANAARVAIARRYDAGLGDLPIVLPRWEGADYVAHLYVICASDREALRASLAERGVETGVHYPVADHLQPIVPGDTHPRLPVTEAACAEVLTLPCFPGLRSGEVDHVVDAVRAHYGVRP